jgi:uncharacterized phage protein gp47/JayE
MVTTKSFSDSVQDSISYLIRNTDITYFSDGSIARAIVETNNFEITRLQQYVSSVFQNSFLSTASGIYLDMWGDTLGLTRIIPSKAESLIEDGAVRFYVTSGTLGTRLPNPTSSGLGLIPSGTTITDATGTVEFVVTKAVSFPVNSRSAFVPVISSDTGAKGNVGARQLVVHDLGDNTVKVTNDISISSGKDTESDEEYRFRLTKALTSRYGSNTTSVEVASAITPGVSQVELLEYARGAGTFDVLLIPQGNKITESIKESTRRAIGQVAAFGVSFEVREPEYVAVKITLQLIFKLAVTDAQKESLKAQVQSNLLAYIANIPLGGELVINQLRAASLISPSIKDIKILELFIDCRSRTLRNVQLREDELFIPDEKSEAIEIV